MKRNIILAVAAGLLLAPAAQAQSATSGAGPAGPATHDAAAPADDLQLGIVPVSDEELGTYRGGERIVVSDQTLVAITSGNTLNGDYTAGSVSLSDNALSSFNGVGTLLINTGAQVSLQTGMSVVINLGP
jgi:hypothetical protein